jgi:hypothetical protein
MNKVRLFIVAMLCVPMALFAQDNIVKLSNGKLNATLNTGGNFTNEPEVKVESEAGMTQWEVDFGDRELEITGLVAPLTKAKVMQQLKKAAATKKEGLKIEIISQDASHMFFKRTRDGEVAYRFMYIATQKGKDYMINSDECDSVEECKKLLVVAKTFKVL